MAGAARSKCPKCDIPLVAASGPAKAKVLLAGDSPGQVEKALGRPFAGPTGDLLRKELTRVGLDYEQFRVTNLWQHDPNEECLAWHQRQLMKEIKGRRLVLLMGSDIVRLLTGHNVTEVSSLTVTSEFVDKGTVLIASFNPAVAFKEGSVVGELRLAMQRFAEAYERMERKDARKRS